MNSPIVNRDRVEIRGDVLHRIQGPPFGWLLGGCAGGWDCEVDAMPTLTVFDEVFVSLRESVVVRTTV